MTPEALREPARLLQNRICAASLPLPSTAKKLREEPKEKLVLIAYDFEIRFPSKDSVPGFLRFDLNPPAHPHADASMRCHFHPGNDDLQAHAPLMIPVEMLELFIYRLQPRDPGKPRAR